MSLLAPVYAEERILSGLKVGERDTTELLQEIQKLHPLTKQGFYAALRKLKAEEAVVLYRGKVALNTAWVRDMSLLTEEMRSAYLPATEQADMLELAQGESVSYVFTTTRHLDAFWGHTQNIIVARTPVAEPVYSYDPHYWFYIAREETERKIVASISQSGRQFLMTAGGDTYLDKVIQKDFTTDDLQYNTEKLFGDPSRYVVVIGDYITEVTLDSRIAREVERIYEQAEALTADARSELEQLLTMKARHRIKITRNAKRAAALKKKMSKHFFVRHT